MSTDAIISPHLAPHNRTYIFTSIRFYWNSFFTILIGIQTATGDKICSQRILSQRIIGIEFLPGNTEYFVCQSTATVAIYQQHAQSKSIRLLQKLLKATSLDTELANLAIRRVAVNVNRSDNRILIAILLNDDRVYVYGNDGNATLPTNLSLVKHFYPLECNEINSNDLPAEHSGEQPNNRFESQAYDVCDIAFAIDGSELWVSDVESRVSIIETQHWCIDSQISVEKRCIRTILRIPEQLLQLIWSAKISSGWIGISNKNELILLYRSNESREIHYKVKRLNESTMQRDMRISCDGQKLIVGFHSGKLQLFCMELLIRQMLGMQLDGLSGKNERIENYANAINQRVSISTRTFVEY